MAVKLGNGNWAVKEDKLLAYNDNSGLFFNKEFDFSRGTSATYVAKDGLIKTAGIQPNVVSNGDFSDGSTDWTLGTGWSISEGKAINDGSQTGNSLLQQASILTLNKLYKVSYDLTVDSGTIYIRLGFGGQGASRTTSGSYTEYVTCSGNTNFDFLATSTYSGSVDNVTVQEIQTDTPRIDFTNDTKGHLLLEPSSTNKVTQSETFSTWSTINSIITTTNILAPDGSTSVVKISSSNITNQEHKIRFFTDTNSATDSIFAKMGEVRYIYSRRLAGQWSSVIFDLQEGVVNNKYPVSSNVYAKMTYYGNGWYRCEVNYTGTLGSNETGWGLSDGANQNYNPSNTTDGLYIWGAQQEDLDFSTSYIPTTGAASTRNADVCNNSGSAQDFNSEEGVLYAEIAALSDSDSTVRSISISDSSSNNRVQIGYITSIRGQVRVGASNQASLFSTQTLSNFNKIALSYKENDFKLFVNGSEAATDTSGSVFSANTLVQLAFYDGSGNRFYGKVRNVQVFTEALTDEQLEKLTS